MKKSEALGGHPIPYSVIPESCEAIICFADDPHRTREWDASIESSFGRVSELEDHNGHVHKTLESLKAAGVSRFVLICRHEVNIDEVLP